MKKNDLRDRTKKFALKIITLYRSLPNNDESRIIGRQMFRSGTSVGAQYHEAYRAKSDPDLISKLQGCLQELEETIFWLDLLKESGITDHSLIQEITKEADELIRIFVSAVTKLKNK